jgi:hypothetical protein
MISFWQISISSQLVRSRTLTCEGRYCMILAHDITNSLAVEYLHHNGEVVVLLSVTRTDGWYQLTSDYAAWPNRVGTLACPLHHAG